MVMIFFNKKTDLKTELLFIIILFFNIVNLSSCSFFKSFSEKDRGDTTSFDSIQETLLFLLENEDSDGKTQFSIINRYANNLLAKKDYPVLIEFLTSWVESHPEDEYNSYYLLMTAYAYLENSSGPLAQYYFERILHNYPDLVIQGQSVHFICLRHLIQLSNDPANRISYFTQLINRFPDSINTTELYARIANEYENLGEWTQSLRTYELFLKQDDAGQIQIADMPNAYTNALQLKLFNESSKNWTFETLDDLTNAVQYALKTRNGASLDRYKSHVNFFATSWRQDENASNAQADLPLTSYIAGKNIRFEDKIDPISTSTEAYLKTWGWSSTYVNVWYFYFRKINFPAAPDYHGRWEWAGIYYGEKM